MLMLKSKEQGYGIYLQPSPKNTKSILLSEGPEINKGVTVSGGGAGSWDIICLVSSNGIWNGLLGWKMPSEVFAFTGHWGEHSDLKRSQTFSSLTPNILNSVLDSPSSVGWSRLSTWVTDFTSVDETSLWVWVWRKSTGSHTPPGDCIASNW